jgi:hypothetical protein
MPHQKHVQCHRLNKVLAKMSHANDKSAQGNKKKAKKMPETTCVLSEHYLSNVIATSHAKAKSEPCGE